jgi:hypothetical protein
MEWVVTAIRAERKAAGLVAPGGKTEPKQGEISFTPEFNGMWDGGRDYEVQIF